MVEIRHINSLNLLLNETIEDDFLSTSGIEEVFVRSHDKGLSQIVDHQWTLLKFQRGFSLELTLHKCFSFFGESIRNSPPGYNSDPLTPNCYF